MAQIVYRGVERVRSRFILTMAREILAKVEANADHWRGLAERQQMLLEDKRGKETHSLFRRLLGR